MRDGDLLQTNVLGVDFDNITLDDAVALCLDYTKSRNAHYIVTPNPEIVMMANKNSLFKAAIAASSLTVADGIGVLYASKIIGRPLKGRIPGIDLASKLIEELAKQNKSVFLFGSKPGIAEKAADNLTAAYPGLVICGTENGYFTDDSLIIEKINTQSPDFLLVCLGAPKQELWMHKNAHQLSVGVMAGLGGSLDVFAGVVDRAPERWQKLGLEWLYRLLKQPSRIGRMAKLPMFLVYAVFERLKGNRHG